MNEALPAVTVRINGFRRLALLDTGCSRSLVTRALCYSWEKKKVDVFTVGEGALSCCGVGRVQIDGGSGCLIDVEGLVADGKLLGFNLLLGFDIIKKLGGVYMTRDGTVSFPQLDRFVYAAITIDKLDFYAEFDQNKKIWVVSWKWSENQTPPFWTLQCGRCSLGKVTTRSVSDTIQKGNGDVDLQPTFSTY